MCCSSRVLFTASFHLELFPSNNSFIPMGRARDNTPACVIIPR